MLYGFDCPKCGCDNEVEIVVDSWGSPGSYGLPEYSEPAEGGEWHTAADARCEACGWTCDDDTFAVLHETAIQERIAEPADPYDGDY